MTKKATPTPPPASDEPQWQVEWVPKDKVIRSGRLQVRHKLNAGAVNQYKARTDAGEQPPPPKVGRNMRGELFLIDGFHRWEAGALDELSADFDGGGLQVRALVATMSDREMVWQAARANKDHGVQLKRSELRNVFKAYVHARKHRRGDKFRSYREMAADLGIPHATLQRWMWKDYPSVAGAIGGDGRNNSPGGLHEVNAETPADALEREARDTLRAVTPHLRAMTPEGRWRAVSEALAFIEEAKALGTNEPATEAGIAEF